MALFGIGGLIRSQSVRVRRRPRQPWHGNVIVRLGLAVGVAGSGFGSGCTSLQKRSRERDEFARTREWAAGDLGEKRESQAMLALSVLLEETPLPSLMGIGGTVQERETKVSEAIGTLKKSLHLQYLFSDGQIRDILVTTAKILYAGEAEADESQIVLALFAWFDLKPEKGSWFESDRKFCDSKRKLPFQVYRHLNTWPMNGAPFAPAFQQIVERATAVKAEVARGFVYAGLRDRTYPKHLWAPLPLDEEALNNPNCCDYFFRLEQVKIPALAAAFDALVSIGDNAGRGSGFIISREGHVLTARHVIDAMYRDPASSTALQGVFLGYREQSVDLTGASLIHWARRGEPDLAILKVPSLAGHAFLSVNQESRGEDELVFSLGYPCCLNVPGEVAALSPGGRIHKGNSGGPLLGIDGSVDGVAVSAAMYDYGMQTKSFIPGKTIVELLQQYGIAQEVEMGK